MSNHLKAFFQAAAYTMNTPAPYSAFHLLLGGTGILGAICLAWYLSGKPARHVLLVCGLVLCASELYKQGFLYYVVNGEQYDWWYFPFQLCSMPMYLCLLVPILSRTAPKGFSKAIYTFIQDFALLGGFMALADPSGLMYPYVVLTLHGFLWHFILIFLGLYCALSGKGSTNKKDFMGTIPLFLGFAGIATFINVASHPWGNADMFYISPYYPNGQIVFHQISLTLGTAAGNLLYLAAAILGGSLVHMGLGRICPQNPTTPEYKINKEIRP